jgi:hypothetical protein
MSDWQCLSVFSPLAKQFTSARVAHTTRLGRMVGNVGVERVIGGSSK